MTRNNNSKPTYTTSQSTLRSISSIDENFNLPDLSGLREDEKQHILSVLLRDENLRNKHLSRFMYVHINIYNNTIRMYKYYCNYLDN